MSIPAGSGQRMPAAWVRERFDHAELSPLWTVLRHRFESGKPVSRVRVGPLDDRQRVALADLLGSMRLPGAYQVVSVAGLDEILVQATGLSTRDVVEAVGGPLGNRSVERKARRTAKENLWSWLGDHPVVAAEPALVPWVEGLRRAGVGASSLDAQRVTFASALAVLDAVPADGRPLPEFADATCGDPHALDEDRRLSGLVLKALALLYGTEEPRDAEQRRALWERAGVACDELSTSVLAAGLWPTEADLLAHSLASFAAAGQAFSVTLAQLRASGRLDAGAQDVWVVENPSVMAVALTTFGPACPPLVCTSGWPNTAAILLLRRLRDSGARLHYHGDFDGDGLRIAAYVCTKTDAVPWRMSTSDYLSAAAHEVGRGVGRVTDAPWDLELADALRTRNVTVPEERVIRDLLSDLQQHRRTT